MPIPLQNVIIITTSMRTMFHTNLNMNLSEQISAPVDTIHLKQLLPQSIQVLFLHSLPNAPHRCVQCGIHRRSDPRFHFRQKSQGFGTKWTASRFPARLPLVTNEIEHLSHSKLLKVKTWPDLCQDSHNLAFPNVELGVGGWQFKKIHILVLTARNLAIYAQYTVSLLQ